MNNMTLRVLIADSHYLIAMDLERILSETGFCVVSLCQLPALKDELAVQRYDVVMLDTMASESANIHHKETVEATGAQVAFITTIDDFQAAFPSLDRYPALQKPFDPDAVTAVMTALRDEAVGARPAT